MLANHELADQLDAAFPRGAVWEPAGTEHALQIAEQVGVFTWLVSEAPPAKFKRGQELGLGEALQEDARLVDGSHVSNELVDGQRFYGDHSRDRSRPRALLAERHEACHVCGSKLADVETVAPLELEQCLAVPGMNFCFEVRSARWGMPYWTFCSIRLRIAWRICGVR